MPASALIKVGTCLKLETSELSKALRRGKLKKGDHGAQPLYAPATRLSAREESQLKEQHPGLAAFLGDATQLLAQYQIKRKPYERKTEDGHIDSEIYLLAAFDADESFAQGYAGQRTLDNTERLDER